MAAYVDALRQEIRTIGRGSAERISVHTVFFGGGTPSLLSPGQVGEILGTVREAFDLRDDAEITLEANPGTVSRQAMAVWREAGVNRLSLGMQSSEDATLKRLGRIHNSADVAEAVRAARAAGLANISLDLIYGIPLQTLFEWEKTLSAALELDVQHLSLYALTLDEGTPLYQAISNGLLPEPDPDLAADMYEMATRVLAQNGFQPYEISNWARIRNADPHAYRCRHNLQYWRNQPYLGFGAGAHGSAEKKRLVNVAGVEEYIARFGEGVIEQEFPLSAATDEVLPIDRSAEMTETMIMGLRLTEEGISEETFRRRFGVEMNTVYDRQIRRLIQQGLLEWAENLAGQRCLRLTLRGRLLGNQAFLCFV